jgi:hypothetical protein
MLDAGERDRFNAAMSLAPEDARWFVTWRAKPHGCSSVFDIYLEVPRYRIAPELAVRITTPLVADPDDEQYCEGQPQRLL